MQQVEHWVLAPLRNRTFFSLDSLNTAMTEKLAELNNRPLSADGAQSRASLFAEYEKLKLQALPIEPSRLAVGCASDLATTITFASMAWPIRYHLG